MVATAILDTLLEQEQVLFATRHSRSQQLFVAGQTNYLYGAPSHWMRRWAGGFPLYVKHAQGAHITCVDEIDYIDFCLGDSGGMCGHASPAITRAVAQQLSQGATFMLPTTDANWVGAELERRFGLPFWGFTTSASDANRAVIRIARMITGREKVLVFNGCYHGSVEEALVALQGDQVVMRNGIHPNAVDHARISKVIEFNDEAALEAALASEDVACVLAEPVMTNFGLIEPRAGFLDKLHELTKRTGTPLIIDETHTFSHGPGGYTAAHGLSPDFLVVGKSVGGGIPVGLYGMSREIAERLWQMVPKVNPARVRQSSHLGFGGTLAGSALQVAAVKVVLDEVLTHTAFTKMIDLAKRLASGTRRVISDAKLPWYVAQSGARVEIMHAPNPPRNATDVARDRNGVLEALVHVFFMNRGVLITPFHNMMLMCPATEAADIDQTLNVLREFAAQLRQSKAYTLANP